MDVRKFMLDDVVTVRKIPMSNRGCDNLRAVQEWLVKGLSEKLNEPVEMPFPTVINYVLEEFVKAKGIEVHGKPSSKQ